MTGSSDMFRRWQGKYPGTDQSNSSGRLGSNAPILSPVELQGAMTVHESFLAVGVHRELPAWHSREVLVNVWRSSPIVVLLVDIVSHGGRLHLCVECFFARRTAREGLRPLSPFGTSETTILLP